MSRLAVILFAVLAVFLGTAAASDCSSFTACDKCIDYKYFGVSQCEYCPVDSQCHTVGSKYNPCTAAQCVSKSSFAGCGSHTCKLEAEDLTIVKYA
eukprot:CAMPEP_0197856666 /NCGR_PEP_ID=MMETSP1438-20131217/29006_1 /TAXON_ID=1461541 /ORGANISM="Pterosperma sp., Strain CCMP1384" /LENGTH=95 /DNA_ID=CAMNT_0043472197 /DNA_START=54 /DNA_END=341 /DNA_ORIENTATION=+